MRVLIADDDPVYRNLLDGLLSKWGFEAVCACNGREACEAIRRDPAIELALLDWMMPEKDGYAVCHDIRQDSSTCDLYILMITSNGLRDELIKVVVAGADDYIIKPFEPLDLKIHVRAAKRIIDLQAQLAGLPGPPCAAPLGLR